MRVVTLCLLLCGCASTTVTPNVFEPRLVTLDTGYRATIGGSCAVTSDGRLLMVTSGPETFSKWAFPISRAELWTSHDHGKTWDGPRVLHRGKAEAVMLPTAMLRLASGKMLMLLGRYGGYDFETHDPEKSLLE